MAATKGKRTPARKGPRIERRGDGPQIVYEYLLGQIMSLALRPGARIEERQVVEKLNISRTPIRQALMRLSSDGLVDLLPNRGARVAPLDLQEVRSFFEAFELIQRAINHLAAIRHGPDFPARLKKARHEYDVAARKGDPRAMIETNRTFHLIIAEATENTHLVRTTRDLLIKAVRLEGLWHTRGDTALRRDVKRSRQEHDSLVAAILRRDVRTAEDLAHIHVRSFREPFLNYLASSNAQDISLYPVEPAADSLGLPR